MQSSETSSDPREHRGRAALGFVTATAGLVAPYLGWLGFATALNTRIVAKNPGILIK